MEEKNLNNIPNENSPLDNRKSVENKEAIEANEYLDKKEEFDSNLDFQKTLLEDKEEKIKSDSTKASELKKKNEDVKENCKIPTKKILFSIKKEDKSAKNQIKNKKTPTIFKINKYKKLRGYIKIFYIKKVKKEEKEKEKELKSKNKIANGIIQSFFRTLSFSDSNAPPPSKRKKRTNRILFLVEKKIFSQNDDDDKLKKEDYYVIRNMCTNYDRNIEILNFRLDYSEVFMSTNYKTN